MWANDSYVYIDSGYKWLRTCIGQRYKARRLQVKYRQLPFYYIIELRKELGDDSKTMMNYLLGMTDAEFERILVMIALDN